MSLPVHPIEDPTVQAEVKAWTEKILDRTGSGKVCVEFDYKDGRCQGTRLGGVTGRKRPEQN